MRARIRIGLAFALLTMPGALAAQAGPPGRAAGPMQMMAQRSPVDIILEHRADLKLSDDQVTKLEAIDRAVEEKNRPHVEKIRETMGNAPTRPGGMQNMTPQEREAMRARREAVRPLMEKIQANNQEGLKQAEEVLAPDQRSQARELIRQAQERRPRPGGPRPG
jgi:hypothetical protein